MPVPQDNIRKARCVVWRGRGQPVPPGLSDALERTGCIATHADNEFEALAKLATATHDHINILLVIEPAAQPALAELLDIVERHAPAAVLWAYEGTPTPQIRAIGSVERSAWRTKPSAWPAAPQPSAPPKLKLQSPQPTPAERRGPVLNPVTPRIADDARTTRQMKISKPNLRLIGDNAGPTPPPSQPEPELKAAPASGKLPSQEPLEPETPPARPSHLLTDEELAMLLAIEPTRGHN
jgi:hypothetical protein